MKTEVAENKGVQGATENKANETKNNIRPSLTGKEAKNEADKTPAPEKSTPIAPGAETKTAETKGGDTPAASAKPAPETVAAEPSKREIKAELQDKKARGLEDTVKLVEQLGKRIAQKNKLFNTISNLDSFVVTQSDDKDDVAADSKFPRCELVISDDDGNEFVTKNPYIIAYVVDGVKSLCIEKLAEVEATIVIPQ